MDVGQRDAIYAWAEQVKSELGPADVLVNNAGVSLSQTIAKMRDEDFFWLMNINFGGSSTARAPSCRSSCRGPRRTS